MSDNKSAHTSDEYDTKISATIPFYNLFHQSIIDLIKTVNNTPQKWLDIGCGTGNLILSASSIFTNTEYMLVDPCAEMIKIAKGKLASNKKTAFLISDSQNLNFENNTFDVITAVQSHHYLDKATRYKAVKNCFRMLKPNGIFISFENILPFSDIGTDIGLKRWEVYQINCGKTITKAKNHINRFGKEYFPISITEHLSLLSEVGFKCVEILWTSYIQAGFYAIK